LKIESAAKYGRQRIEMPTMYRRKNQNPGRWTKLLHKLSRLVGRVRSQASADIAIAQAERAVRRKIKAAGKAFGAATQRQDDRGV
jgi:hypothetical protein